ncbi:MAG TPA: NAD(P)/FAD-dependent oxidoreductase [Burkholderiales bacterium]|jgi:halogenation protein CepH|nr:NAD(P)/FAD-dependent oxidoreductase [Burkholderiales bacterium]
MPSERFDVVVIGGGPGGSSTAAALARKGRRVLLLERARFPRFSTGESLVAGLWDVFADLGVTAEIEAAQFMIKVGVRFVFSENEVVVRPSEFPDYFPRGYTLHVERARFDKILLDHAAKCGVDVRQEWTVRDVLFEGGCAVGVLAGPNGQEPAAIHCSVVVDGSGRDCLVARKLGWRKPDPKLNRVSYFTHYEGAHFSAQYGGLDRTVLDVHTMEGRGWAWYIPLAKGVTSVGVVLDLDYVRSLGLKGAQERYNAAIKGAPEICGWLQSATQIMPMQTISNISYLNESFVGDGFVLVGDAAMFLDPIFSAGVFVAARGGIFAARSIDAALEAGDVSARMLRPYERAIRYPMSKMFKMIYNWYDLLAQPGGDNIFRRSLSAPLLRERLVVLWSGGYDRVDMDNVLAGMDQWTFGQGEAPAAATAKLRPPKAAREDVEPVPAVPPH